MKDNINIERINADFNQGLTNEQISQRKKQGLAYKYKKAYTKSLFYILITSLLDAYNITMYITIAILMIYKMIVGIVFASILLCYIGITLFLEFKARYVLSKNNKKIVVIRNGTKQEINEKNLVLDDVIYVETGSKIPLDAIVLEGAIEINESFVTGKDKPTYKSVNDEVEGNAVVTSGSAYLKINTIYGSPVLDGANKIRYVSSNFAKTLRILFIVIGVITVLLAIDLFFVNMLENRTNFSIYETRRAAIIDGLTILVPTGLSFLIALALLIKTLSFAKQKIILQDQYSLDTFAKIDTVCFDKTGILTDGNYTVKKIVPLTARYLDDYIAQATANVLRATNDQNPIAKALLKEFDLELTAGVNVALPFNGDNKYAGASFKGGKTFIIGDLENVPIKNKAGIIKRCDEYYREGNRVIALAEGKELIKDNKYTGSLEPIALIILKDYIRDGALETLQWLKVNNIDVKIISGDDIMAVSSLAAEAGIAFADRFISLDELPIEEVKHCAFRYAVFGKATPEQKEAIIKTLQEGDRTVAMVGDGYNDILALKRSHCSIAVENGSDGAKNVSQVILKDSNLKHIPEIIKEGRRVTNNLIKVVSLFAAKALFAILLTAFFGAILLTNETSAHYYPYVVNNFILWDAIISGAAAFALAFDKNKKKMQGSFAANVLKNAIPGGILLFVPILILFSIYFMQQSSLVSFGVYTEECAVAMTLISFNVLGLVYLYKICSPLTNFRKIVFVSATALVVLSFATSIILTYVFNNYSNRILQIPFTEMNGPSYVTTAIVTIVFAAIYIFINQAISIKKGDADNYEN